MTDLAVPESVGPPPGGQPDKVTRSVEPLHGAATCVGVHRSRRGCDRLLGFLRELLPSAQYRSLQRKLDLVRLDPDLHRDRIDRTCRAGWAETFTSGLPLLSMGIVFGIHGVFVSFTRPGAQGLSWGYGVYMISVGSGILTSPHCLWWRCGSETFRGSHGEPACLRGGL